MQLLVARPIKMNPTLPPITEHPLSEAERHIMNSECSLSSAPTDPDLYFDLKSRATRRLNQYNATPGDDTVRVLEAALEHIPKHGQVNLMYDITELVEDEALRTLRDHFVSAILTSCEPRELYLCR